LRLYPPYKKWEVEIQNIEKYRAFLEKKIEYFHTNKYATLKGKLNENGFFVRRIQFTKNPSRPHVRGIISNLENGKHQLTLTMESNKYFLYFSGGLGILMIISAISSNNLPFLSLFPFFLVFFYLIGYFFYISELGRTKLEFKKLYSAAQEK
jgi:hypothetical protein